MSFLAEVWRNWQMLFGMIPYGDPYLAWGGLMVLYFPIRKFIRYIF